MLTLNATQKGIVYSSSKSISWLFEVVATAATSYYWSIKDYSYDGDDYTGYVLPESFSGIKVSRSQSEFNMYVPNKLTFSTVDPNNDFIRPNKFIDGSINLSLVIKNMNDSEEALIESWKFNITNCEQSYYVYKFTCEDILAKHIEGYYPNTELVVGLTPSIYSQRDEEFCVPKIFGKAYIPLVPALIDTQTHYVMGETGIDYTVHRVHAPKEWKVESASWVSSDNYPFVQIDNKPTGYKSVRPMIGVPGSFFGSDNGTIDVTSNNKVIDNNAGWSLNEWQSTTANQKYYAIYLGSGSDRNYGLISANTATALNIDASWDFADQWDSSWDFVIRGCGIWKSGTQLYSMPCQFERSDTKTESNASKTIKWLLKDFGVPAGDINDTTFSDFVSYCSTHVINFNGGFYEKEDRKNILGNMLTGCGAYLISTDKLEIHTRSATAVTTLTSSHIVKDSFKSNYIKMKDYDSAYVSWQEENEPQDKEKLIKTLVSCYSNGATANTQSEILELPYQKLNQLAQRAGQLYYFDKYMKTGNKSFSLLGSHIALQPGDIINIGANELYGSSSTYSARIDEIYIKQNGTLDITASTYATGFETWGARIPANVTVDSDELSTPANEINRRDLVFQYSIDGETNWHTTFDADNDLYARKKLQGDSDWDSTYKLVGEDGEDGTDGTDGTNGPSITFTGEYAAGTTYYNDAVRRDVVYYTATTTYYYRSGATGSGNLPTDTDYWTSMTSFDSVATGLLFAEDAVINKNLQVGSATYACGRIVVNSDGAGIIVRNGGSINVEEGGDINLTGSSGNPALLVFKNSARKNAFYRYLDDTATPNLLLDHPTSSFASCDYSLYARDINFYSVAEPNPDASTGTYSRISLNGNAALGAEISFVLSNGGTGLSKALTMVNYGTTLKLYPVIDKRADLGLSTNKWNDIFADTVDAENYKVNGTYTGQDVTTQVITKLSAASYSSATLRFKKGILVAYHQTTTISNPF